MNEQHNPELVSALLDGELGRHETRFALRRLDADAAALGQWERWHLVRAALRREPLGLAAPGFASAVMQAVAAGGGRRRVHAWLKPLAGGAIAAGVAVLALFAVTPRPGPGEYAVQAPVPELSAPTGLTTGDFSPRLASRPVVATTLAPVATHAIEIERYFLSHSGQATGFARGGFVPYVNIVATPEPLPSVAGPATVEGR